MIETDFGFETEDGQVLAYKEKCSFLNFGRAEEFKNPIIKEIEGEK